MHHPSQDIPWPRIIFLYHFYNFYREAKSVMQSNLLHCNIYRNTPIHSLHSLSNNPLARLLSQFLALLKTLPDREDAVDYDGVYAFFYL